MPITIAPQYLIPRLKVPHFVIKQESKGKYRLVLTQSERSWPVRFIHQPQIERHYIELEHPRDERGRDNQGIIQFAMSDYPQISLINFGKDLRGSGLPNIFMCLALRTMLDHGVDLSRLSAPNDMGYRNSTPRLYYFHQRFGLCPPAESEIAAFKEALRSDKEAHISIGRVDGETGRYFRVIVHQAGKLRTTKLFISDGQGGWKVPADVYWANIGREALLGLIDKQQVFLGLTMRMNPAFVPELTQELAKIPEPLPKWDVQMD